MQLGLRFGVRVYAGYGVVAALAEWVATCDPTQAEPRSFKRAVGPERVHRVVRTARCKAALMADPRAKDKLVQTNQADQKCFHHACSLACCNNDSA